LFYDKPQGDGATPRKKPFAGASGLYSSGKLTRWRFLKLHKYKPEAQASEYLPRNSDSLARASGLYCTLGVSDFVYFRCEKLPVPQKHSNFKTGASGLYWNRD